MLLLIAQTSRAGAQAILAARNMLAPNAYRRGCFGLQAIVDICVPDGHISILDALNNSCAVPLHSLGVYSYHLCQGVQGHISDVVVSASARSEV